MEGSIQKLYLGRFPELGEAKGEFEVLEQVTRRRLENGTVTTKKKIIKIAYDGTDQDLYGKLLKVKGEIEGTEQIIFHHVNSMSTQKFRKLIAWIFHDTGIKQAIYTTRRRAEMKDADKPSKLKERSTYALSVKDGPKDYKTLLTVVKEKLRNSVAKEKIRNLRSTHNGELLIEMDKDDVALQDVQKALHSESGDQQIREVGTREETEVIHLRGLDAIAEKKDVLEALRSKFGAIEKKRVKIGDLRSTRDNMQSAVIMVGRECLKKWGGENRIRVGLVSCTLNKRIKVGQCGKCWAYNHRTSECKGLDRSKACYKCGQEGHNIKACEQEPACPLCVEVGHKTGSGNCRAFRQALNKKKKEIGAGSVPDPSEGAKGDGTGEGTRNNPA